MSGRMRDWPRRTFGTQHYEMTISAGDFAAFMPQYVWHMEEPVCEPPAIAMYYVSKLARNYVTVLLSGEGGDEAFAGYSNYRNLVWLERFKSGISPLNGARRAGTFFCQLAAAHRPRCQVRAFDDGYLSPTIITAALHAPYRYTRKWTGQVLLAPISPQN